MITGRHTIHFVGNKAKHFKKQTKLSKKLIQQHMFDGKVGLEKDM